MNLMIIKVDRQLLSASDLSAIMSSDQVQHDALVRRHISIPALAQSGVSAAFCICICIGRDDYGVGKFPMGAKCVTSEMSASVVTTDDDTFKQDIIV